MARAKQSDESVRLTHVNGASVSVTPEKADRLLAGSDFSKGTASKSASADK